MKILVLKGLPASGKSTYAKELVETGGNWKRVNKDDLRDMIDCGKWSGKNEKFILKMRNWVIIEALNAKYNVVIDDTNLHPKHLQEIKDISRHYDGVTVETKFFDVPVEECIKRDLKRQRSVGEKVIRDMYNKYLKPEEEKVVLKQDTSLPRAIIVDIDGTVAEKGDRSPYDWARVGEDTPKREILGIVYRYALDGYKILFVSGRDGVCFNETSGWLAKHYSEFYGVAGHQLFMRPKGNMEKDVIIKQRIFNDHIKNKYYVDFALDDRPSVIRMWHSLGLNVIDVDPCSGEF